MKTRKKGKQAVKQSPARQVEKQASARPRKLIGRGIKVRLLLLLLASLAIVGILHVLAVYAQAPASQPTTCAQLMGSADYAQAVNLQSDTQEMSAVEVVNSLDDGAPAALVQVTNKTTPTTLDVYVFGCAMRQGQPRLTQLLSRRGLVHGAATVTAQHTLIIQNQDTSLQPEVLPFLQPLQQNIYHEYTWQQNAFAQVAYSAFYPVSSRAEAQALQQSANDGQPLPWNDPVSTALQLSKDILRWSPDPQAQLIAHTGDTATVQLTEQSPHVVLLVTLKQLIQPGANGLWFVTDARTKGLTVTRADALDQPLPSLQSSPLRFGGTNALVDGQTTATLFDHTMTPVKQATSVPVTVHADSSYFGSLSYTNLLSGQQGILLISSMPKTENLNKESGQMLLTGVILN